MKAFSAASTSQSYVYDLCAKLPIPSNVLLVITIKMKVQNNFYMPSTSLCYISQLQYLNKKMHILPAPTLISHVNMAMADLRKLFTTFEVCIQWYIYNRLPNELKLISSNINKFKANLNKFLYRKSYYTLDEFFNDKIML
jgi:hypothetical protein